ncbi:DUF4912 domain-containing protein [Bacteroidia bacterium]|nr:DUF4912 domain-containing protein [Bacteroidia bacterium]
MDTKRSSTSFIQVEKKENKAARELPSSYGRTEAFLLPKDPGWLFLFWEITSSTYDYIKSQNGYDIFDRSKTIVRLHDVTDINFDGTNSNAHFDTPIVFDAGSWYLQAPSPGRNYVADLGIITPEGKFILLARSNAVTLPTGRISDIVDEKWMLVEGDYQKLLALSGANLIGLGASELAHALHERWRFAQNMPSSYSSSSKSSGAAVKKAAKTEEDDMWLKADCEIIIYGSASPGAKVKINGKEIELNNGSFSIRQSLQKGEIIDLPITAEKKKMKRSIKIKAQRED